MQPSPVALCGQTCMPARCIRKHVNIGLHDNAFGRQTCSELNQMFALAHAKDTLPGRSQWHDQNSGLKGSGTPTLAIGPSAIPILASRCSCSAAVVVGVGMSWARWIAGFTNVGSLSQSQPVFRSLATHVLISRHQWSCLCNQMEGKRDMTVRKVTRQPSGADSQLTCTNRAASSWPILLPFWAF